MKNASLFFIASAVVFRASAIAADSNAKADTIPPAAVNNTAPSGKDVPNALTEGMTGEEIQGIIGKPAEIKPFDSPAGKAETWTYRRVLDKQTEQETVSVPDTARTNGRPDAGGTAVKTQTRAKHTTTYQVTTLLLFDGKLVKARQTVTKAVTYDE